MCSVCFSRRPVRPLKRIGSLPRIAHADARMFFNTPDFDLDEAVPGTFSLAPSTSMLDALERDYNAMATMIMGPVPPVADVMDAVSSLETRLNAQGPELRSLRQ
jgi:hypothetical protein